MKAKLFFCIVLLLGSLPIASYSNDGEKLFKANCSVCHTIGKGKLVGPDLKDVTKRRDEAWILRWVPSSQALVKSGDPTAVKLFQENGGIIMPDAVINADEIKQIVEYFKLQSSENHASASTIPHSGSGIHDNPIANPETHVEVQNQQVSLLGLLSFGGYILAMLTILALIVLWVLFLYKKTSEEAKKFASL